MTQDQMLNDLVAANRDRYEQRGEPISNVVAFDSAFRNMKLRDEETNPGSIEASWKNLNGQGKQRAGAHTSSGPSATRYELALSFAVDQLASSARWTPESVEAFLVDAEDIAPLVARRAVDAAVPIADEIRAEAARRQAQYRADDEARTKTRDEQHQAPKTPTIPRLAPALPAITSVHADPDDDSSYLTD